MCLFLGDQDFTVTIYKWSSMKHLTLVKLFKNMIFMLFYVENVSFLRAPKNIQLCYWKRQNETQYCTCKDKPKYFMNDWTVCRRWGCCHTSYLHSLTSDRNTWQVAPGSWTKKNIDVHCRNICVCAGVHSQVCVPHMLKSTQVESTAGVQIGLLIFLLNHPTWRKKGLESTCSPSVLCVFITSGWSLRKNVMQSFLTLMGSF